MALENKEGSSLPLSGILGALLVTLTIVAQQIQLDSPRPAPIDQKRPPTSTWLQDIETRMWQDPFAAIAQYRDTERQSSMQREQLARQLGISQPKLTERLLPPDDKHDISAKMITPGYHTICEQKDDVRVLAVMLLGGRSDEDAEMRRRTRYAVVSGLMNSQYVPSNSEAIGYAYVPDRLRATYDTRLPETLPFEWFKYAPKSESDTAKQWILVVWLDQAVFYARPLARLRHLIRILTPKCIGNKEESLDTTVLGPVDSDSLRAMINEVKESRGSKGRKTQKAAGNVGANAIPLRIISASATGSLGELGGGSEYYFKESNVTFGRLVGPDIRLSAELIEEIHTRNVTSLSYDKTPAVIVINEHDTDYGRAFHEQIRKGVEASAKGGNKLQVETFSYLRQIDGGRPNDSSSRAKSAGSEGAQDASRSHAPFRSHGAVHTDYLARLVQNLKAYSEGEAEADGKPASRGKKDVVAIAILGNDVYDKLLILRALKPSFPKALFMTTDMDARLLDPAETRWTRNLIVATNYGLSLSREVQAGAASFRDGYQTATYLATLLIGGRCGFEVLGQDNKEVPWLKVPLLFEIGRSEAIPLKTLTTADRQGDLSKCSLPLFDEPANKLRNSAMPVQPDIRLPKPPLAKIGGFLAIVIIAGYVSRLVWLRNKPSSLVRLPRTLAFSSFSALTLSLISLAAGLWISYMLDSAIQSSSLRFLFGIFSGVVLCFGLWFLRDGLADRKTRKVLCGSILVAPALWITTLAIYRFCSPGEEPFAWMDGVSVWPTQLLRILATAIAVYAIWRIGSASADNAVDVGARLGASAVFSKDNEDSLLRKIWSDYADQRPGRIVLTISAAFLYFLICGAVMLLLEASPGVPVRGGANLQSVQSTLGLVVFLGIALLLGVTIAYSGFILGVLRPLKRNCTTSLEKFIDAVIGNVVSQGAITSTYSSRRFGELVLALEIVVERSCLLTRFVYFPFAVFAILLVARSPLFDMWDTPIGLAIVLGLPFLMVIGCIGWLRWETIEFHKAILRAMDDELIHSKSPGTASNEKIWQMEKLYARAQNERRGSFQSLALQPLVRALLFPIAGISGIEILEHVVLKQQ